MARDQKKEAILNIKIKLLFDEIKDEHQEINFVQNAAELKSLIGEIDFNFELPFFRKHISLADMKMPKDHKASKDLDYFKEKNYIAFQSTANGNCLFNAVSTALYGEESCCQIIRLMTLQYIVKHYLDLVKVQSTMATSKSVDETLLNCALDHGWSNVLTLHCVAQALRITVHGILLPHNGVCDINYMCTKKYFSPDVGKARTEVHLLWTSTYTVIGYWKANHIVPLLHRESGNVQTVDIEYSCTASDNENDKAMAPVINFPDKGAIVRHMLQCKTTLTQAPFGPKSNCQFVLKRANGNGNAWQNKDGLGPWKRAINANEMIELETGRNVKEDSRRYYYTTKVENEVDEGNTVVNLRYTFYINAKDPNFTKRIYVHGDLFLFQYFGEHSSGFMALPITVAADMILNNKIQPGVVPKDGLNQLVIPKPTYQDTCNRWTGVNYHYYHVIAERVGDTWASSMHRGSEEGVPNVRRLAKISYVSKCHPKYYKVKFEIDSRKLLQYYGKVGACTCDDGRALNIVRNNFDLPLRKIYFKYLPIFDDVTTVSRHKRTVERERKKDLVKELLKLPEDGFVQHVHQAKEKEYPDIYLFKQESIIDMFSLAKNHKAVFYCVHTLKVSKYNVTALCYFNHKLVSRAMKTSPLFIGPILLHSADDDMNSFVNFFKFIKEEFQQNAFECQYEEDVEDLFTFTTSQESSLNPALRVAFPRSRLIFSSKRIRNEINSKVQNRKVGKELLGLLECSDQANFMYKVTNVMQGSHYKDMDENAKQNVLDVVNTVYNYVCRPKWENQSPKKVVGTIAETTKHKIRAYISYKRELDPVDLIADLKEICDVQFVDIQRAFINKGNYFIQGLRKLDEDDPEGLEDVYNKFLRGQLDIRPSVAAIFNASADSNDEIIGCDDAEIELVLSHCDEAVVTELPLKRIRLDSEADVPSTSKLD